MEDAEHEFFEAILYYTNENPIGDAASKTKLKGQCSTSRSIRITVASLQVAYGGRSPGYGISRRNLIGEGH